MVGMRALVVDDSKSARAFLAKLLEEQQIEVDAVETAEQAIDYLTGRRPDVIFMDHLMPGMDGFQAVQAIKANPRTADIPVLMYTSQEGELYLGQARALGAAGVVQKSMSAADVRALLQQLQLVPGAAAQVLVPPRLQVEAPAALQAVEFQAAVAGPGVESFIKEEVAVLRQEFAASLQSHSEQMLREMRNLRAAIPPTGPAPAPVLAPPPAILPEKPRHSPGPWLLAVAASVAAATLGTLWWQSRQQLLATSSELMDSRSTVALLTARLAPTQQSADVALNVPFGEAPLSGARADALREFVARIAAQGQQGSVEVRHFAGRFCVTGSSTTGFALADATLPAAQCDLVVDATDPLLGAPPLEAADFTTALAELRKQYASLSIDVAVGDGRASGHAYTEAGADKAPTAGAWNAAAAANNRVELRWRPTP
jgi:CheY-like chemotaxis protein